MREGEEAVTSCLKIIWVRALPHSRDRPFHNLLFAKERRRHALNGIGVVHLTLSYLPSPPIPPIPPTIPPFAISSEPFRCDGFMFSRGVEGGVVRVLAGAGGTMEGGGGVSIK